MNDHTSMPRSALLAECFAGALTLTTRYEYLHRPVARRNERARATSEGGTREGGDSRLDQATVNDHTSMPRSALLAECFAGALTLTTRYEYLHRPVARRNERARATSEGGTREGGDSRLDKATVKDHTSVPKSALLAECFAGALRLRRATGACEPLERSACIKCRRAT